ncbi:MAG: type VI secretion system contractile sheath small subunit [Deltaproteobacteria bacterium]|nr:type VI secretion system contractile sheath small subunit [Deltaproteobacteria bacterium]
MPKNNAPNNERVQIVYKSQVDQSEREVELPFKLLVLGNFSQSANDASIEDRDPIMVTKENFDAVLKSMGIKLDLLVENRLAKEATTPIRLSLAFNRLEDFEPHRLTRQVAPLKKLVDLSQSLVKTKKILATKPTVLEKLKSILADSDKKQQFMEQLLAYKDQLDQENNLTKTN